MGFFASVDVRPAPYGGPSCPAPTRGAGAEFAPDPLWGAGLPRPPVGGWGDIRARKVPRSVLWVGLRALLVPGVGFGRIYGTNKGLRQSEGVLGRVKND